MEAELAGQGVLMKRLVGGRCRAMTDKGAPMQLSGC